MSADWKSLAREGGLKVSADDSIEVQLDGGWRQTVQADSKRSPDALRISTVIAAGKTLRDAGGDDALRYAWERNRFSDLVGFTVDGRGRLIGEAWIPYEALTADELTLQVRELARVSNWHELRLTGMDEY